MIEQGREVMHSAEIEVMESIEAQWGLDLLNLYGIMNALECGVAANSHRMGDDIRVDPRPAMNPTATIAQPILRIGAAF